MSLGFRACRDEDVAAVIALWKACDILRSHHDPQREVAFVREAANGELFLAFTEERLVGSVIVGHDSHRAWMYRVAVDPALRGRGHGRALVARAEAWAIARPNNSPIGELTGRHRGGNGYAVELVET